jgi:hypothetical protein
MSTKTTLPIANALFVRGLELPNKMAMVYAQDYGYNVLTQLSAKVSSSIETMNPKVEVSALGNLSVFSPVTAAPTLSGVNLLVTVADPTGFRKGDVTGDANLVMGKVVSVAGNVITLEPVNGVSLNASTHFQVNHTAKVLFDSSTNRGSTGKTTFDYVPDTNFTYTGVMRESSSLDRRDKTSSFVKWKGDAWYTSKDELVVKRFAKSNEYNMYLAQLGVSGSGTSEAYQTAGVRWSIINRGGTYMPLTSALTQASWHNFLEEMVRKSSNNGRRLVALMGAAAMASLQDIAAPYIQYAGTSNTFGGTEVQGLSVMKYSYLGLSVDFVRWAFLDDEPFRSELSSVTGKPRMSHSILLVDLTPVPTADGSGEISPLQKYHFTGSELITNYIPGMIGLENNPSGVYQKGMSLTTSDLDSVKFEILSDSGYYMVADRMGLIEMVA